MKVRIEAGRLSLTADLLDTPTARALLAALPFEARALPYRRTPISTDERPKLAARCNVVGRLEEDPRELAKIRSGDRITVSKA